MSIPDLLRDLDLAESVDVQIVVLNELCTLLCFGMEVFVGGWMDGGRDDQDYTFFG